jgi:hypothetical protein
LTGNLIAAGAALTIGFVMMGAISIVEIAPDQ